MLDLLGELGGVLEVVIVIFSFIFYPISEQSFILKFAKTFYKGRTTQTNVLKSAKMAGKADP